MGSILLLGLGLALTSVLAALGTLILFYGFQPARRGAKSLFDDQQVGTVFLFDGERLLDCTPGGRAVLAGSTVGGSEWMRLLAHLALRFPDVDGHLGRLDEQGIVNLEGEDSDGVPLVLQVERRGGLTWIRITEATAEARTGDPIVQRALTEELTSLRNMLTQAPILAWREREDGGVIWANSAYVLLAAERIGPGENLGWPLPSLFGQATARGPAGPRQKLVRVNGTTQWFDLTMIQEGRGRRGYAVSCDAAVAAETSLRDFMQTLAKTFAHLPTGLAVFDSQKHLQMFNPALLDLTGLQPDFLSSRPSMVTFLDAMRDANMVPEPKDYRQWRRRLVDMEGADETGFYQEQWNLAGGQTYRITGRPHTNGSVALMFEDISTEISRSRRYRADLELGQAVVDAMDEAIAVFSATGHLVMANRAYCDLWQSDPFDSLTESSFRSVVGQWRERCAPALIWSEMEAFVGTIGDRIGWATEARLLDGRLLSCRLHPLQDGATLIGFRPAVIAATVRKAPAAKATRLRRPA